MYTQVFYIINLTREVSNASSTNSVTSVLQNFTLFNNLEIVFLPQEQNSEKEGDEFYHLLKYSITQNTSTETVRKLKDAVVCLN